ncbi:CvfD/Ygs/GSP13 family RNA-binding post-transcriptional regulator [Oenococcus alcoholitolerans]|uniref:CvfD/Ygs/GSP13 family RNA-binding post-transcriptional regulator n=1 Tax=Oenococcus alcoholitolerans TaxID=931074 RepID=UPI003F728D74
MKYEIGQKVYGVISGVQSYGVFVQLDHNVQGLVHISECRNGRVDDLKKYFHVGQRVESIVLDIDDYSKKISLSFRQLSIPIIKAKALPKEKKDHRIYKHFWTSSKVKTGFKPIKETIESNKNEALKRIRKDF